MMDGKKPRKTNISKQQKYQFMLKPTLTSICYTIYTASKDTKQQQSICFCIILDNKFKIWQNENKFLPIQCGEQKLCLLYSINFIQYLYTKLSINYIQNIVKFQNNEKKSLNSWFHHTTKPVITKLREIYTKSIDDAPIFHTTNKQVCTLYIKSWCYFKLK